jgi:hypothetical protein
LLFLSRTTPERSKGREEEGKGREKEEKKGAAIKSTTSLG